MADAKPVTHDEAAEIAQRFIDYFFGNKAKAPHVEIPANLERDDDIRLSDYIAQQKAASATRQADVATVRDCMRALLADGWTNLQVTKANEALDRLAKE